jgi:hypothetical protein
MRTSGRSDLYAKAKARAKARSAAITLAGQDIAPLPKVADAARRTRADRDFKFFCESYFLHLFTLAGSAGAIVLVPGVDF